MNTLYMTPLLAEPVPAGFPSPADDHVETRINLDDYLAPRREATFLMRAAGKSMTNLGIHDGDLLVVDRSLPVTSGCVVIAVLDGAFTVKQWRPRDGGVVLGAAHPDHADILVAGEQEVTVWGVVRWAIHRVGS